MCHSWPKGLSQLVLRATWSSVSNIKRGWNAWRVTVSTGWPLLIWQYQPAVRYFWTSVPLSFVSDGDSSNCQAVIWTSVQLSYVSDSDGINLLVAVWTSVLFSFVLDSSSINWQSAIFERLSRFPLYETVTLSINWQAVIWTFVQLSYVSDSDTLCHSK